MMKLTQTLLLLILAAAIPASAATITLTQSGWDEGGPLTITFTGEDADANGAFELTELSAFQAAFELPASGGTKALTLADLFEGDFYFASTFDYFISAANEELALYTIAFPDEPPIAVFSWDYGSAFAFTEEPLQSAVPEPASLMLLGGPLATLFAVRRAFASRLVRERR